MRATISSAFVGGYSHLMIDVLRGAHTTALLLLIVIACCLAEIDAPERWQPVGDRARQSSVVLNVS